MAGEAVDASADGLDADLCEVVEADRDGGDAEVVDGAVFKASFAVGEDVVLLLDRCKVDGATGEPGSTEDVEG